MNIVRKAEIGFRDEIPLEDKFDLLRTQVPDYLLKIGEEKFLKGRTLQAVKDEFESLRTSRCVAGCLYVPITCLLVALMGALIWLTTQNLALVCAAGLIGIILILMAWGLSSAKHDKHEVVKLGGMLTIADEINQLYYNLLALDPVADANNALLKRERLSRVIIATHVEKYILDLADKFARFKTALSDTKKDGLEEEFEALEIASKDFYTYWDRVKFWCAMPFPSEAFIDLAKRTLMSYRPTLPTEPGAA